MPLERKTARPQANAIRVAAPSRVPGRYEKRHVEGGTTAGIGFTP